MGEWWEGKRSKLERMKGERKKEKKKKEGKGKRSSDIEFGSGECGQERNERRQEDMK